MSCFQGRVQGFFTASVLEGQFLTTHTHVHTPLEAHALTETHAQCSHKYTHTLTPMHTRSHQGVTLTAMHTHTIHTHAHSLPCTHAHTMCIPVHTLTHTQHSSLQLLPVSLGFLNNSCCYMLLTTLVLSELLFSSLHFQIYLNTFEGGNFKLLPKWRTNITYSK